MILFSQAPEGPISWYPAAAMCDPSAEMATEPINLSVSCAHNREPALSRKRILPPCGPVPTPTARYEPSDDMAAEFGAPLVEYRQRPHCCHRASRGTTRSIARHSTTMSTLLSSCILMAHSRILPRTGSLS